MNMKKNVGGAERLGAGNHFPRFCRPSVSRGVARDHPARHGPYRLVPALRAVWNVDLQALQVASAGNGGYHGPEGIQPYRSGAEPAADRYPIRDQAPGRKVPRSRSSPDTPGKAGASAPRRKKEDLKHVQQQSSPLSPVPGRGFFLGRFRDRITFCSPGNAPDTPGHLRIRAPGT